MMPGITAYLAMGTWLQLSPPQPPNPQRHSHPVCTGMTAHAAVAGSLPPPQPHPQPAQPPAAEVRRRAAEAALRRVHNPGAPVQLTLADIQAAPEANRPSSRPCSPRAAEVLQADIPEAPKATAPQSRPWWPSAAELLESDMQAAGLLVPDMQAAAEATAPSSRPGSAGAAGLLTAKQEPEAGLDVVELCVPHGAAAQAFVPAQAEAQAAVRAGGAKLGQTAKPGTSCIDLT